jgi:hypothetical protein
MDTDKTCTATFGYPIGGIVVPVNKLELVAPWIRLAALASFAALTVALVRRRTDQRLVADIFTLGDSF